jgi:hypothetical protein
MRFLTDDGQFGLLVTPLTGRGMFRFQLVIDGRLIGDTEPCFLGTAMGNLGNLPHLDDERLGLLSSDPDVVLSALLSEEQLHDPATLPLAESLDHWLIHGYVYEGNVVMIARADEDGSLAGPTWISVVGSTEYDAIFDAAHSYWSKTNNLAK